MAKRQRENKNVWLLNLLNRRHSNIAAVALANKNVRTVWALLAHGRDFKPGYVPVRATAELSYTAVARHRDRVRAESAR
jgi:transposase